MALAILQLDNSNITHKRFKANIGDNHFFTYAIGRGKKHDSNGLDQLEHITFTSPLIGPIAETSLGRTTLQVPSHYFDHENRWIQLTSFRTEDQVGPAISEILEIIPSLTDTRPFPSLSMSLNQDLTMSPPSMLSPNPSTQSQVNSLTPPDTVPFQYVEAQSHYSEGMFLGSLLNAISGVAGKILPMVTKAIPVVGNVLGGLLGGGGGGTAGGADLTSGIGNLLGGLLGDTPQASTVTANGATKTSTSGQATLAKLLANPETAKLLKQLLQQKAATDKSAQLKSANPSDPASLTAKTLETLLEQTKKVSQKTGDEVATAAALSFEELSEQQSVLDFFRKMAGTLTGGLKDVGEFILGNAPTIIEFLASNPELLAAVALSKDVQVVANPKSRSCQELRQETTKHVMGLSTLTIVPDYQRIDAVQLRFVGVVPHDVRGRTVALYRQDRDILFPLALETPRRINRANLYLVVTHAATLEKVVEQTYPLENITAGKLPVSPRLSYQQLQRLEPNTDYLVSVALVWTAKFQQTGEVRQVGTNQTQRISLMGECCFDRLGEVVQTVPLNDVEKYRPYWHKIWQGDLQDNAKPITWDCKYYHALETNRDNNARMETVTTLDDEDFMQRSGRLKTGMIYSPYRLNELLQQISSYPSLQESELKALKSDEFKDRFSSVAQTQMTFESDEGNTVAVWVYPEMKLQQMTLKKTEQTDENGQILRLSERSVVVPIPSVAHFIGVRGK